MFQQWQSDLQALAKCQNVIAKLGEINMPEKGFHWEKRLNPPSSQDLIDATRYFYELTIDNFWSRALYV